MTTISLRDYNQHIDRLVNDGAHNEAIFHCTNVLRSYPKYVDIYRNLGRALLESAQFSEAAEVFSKVLAVYPDDFVSHAGLSEIFEEQGNLDKAIWHMEHSFESQPSSLQIQDELKRLFAKRDGVPPAKIRLTRGALIRMYAKGELYQQAIAESLSSLEADQNRIDIRVLLAKMYQASGSNIEAAETCSQILDQLPYCYEANRIMHEINIAHETSNEPSIYMQRMVEVDPYLGLINESHQSALDVPSDAIILDKPEYTGPESSEDDIPEWAQQIGLTWIGAEGGQTTESEKTLIFEEAPALLEDETLPITPENSISQPADDLLGNVESIPEIMNDEIEAKLPETSQSVEEDLPDWIAKAGWIRALEDEIDTEVNTDNSSLSEPEMQDEDNASPAEELPDWLKSLNPENLTPGDENAAVLGMNLPADIGSESADIASISPETLDELLTGENIFDTSSSEPQSPQIEAIDEDRFLGASDIILEEKEAKEVPDLPDWLKDLDIVEATPPESDEFRSDWTSTEEKIDDEIEQVINDTFIADSPSESASLNQYIEDIQPGQAEQEETTPVAFETVAAEMGDEFVLKTGEPPDLPQETPAAEVFTSHEHVESNQVPTWVQKILGTAGPVVPQVMASRQPAEIKPEEVIEPLITELPGELPEEGAISEDVNLELMSWLEDINPDDALETPQDAGINEDMDQVVLQSEAVSEFESAEITFENLTDPTVEEIGESIIEHTDVIDEDSIPVPDDLGSRDLNDRLTSLTGQERGTDEETKIGDDVNSDESIMIEEPSSVVEIGETSILEDVPLDNELFTKLLNDKRYNEIDEIILEKSLTDELLNELNSKILEKVADGTESFDLWKTMGDVNMKLTDLDVALDAYKKAESLLFHK